MWIATLPQPGLQFWIDNYDLNTFCRPAVAQQAVQNLSSYYGSGEPSPEILIEKNDCVLMRGQIRPQQGMISTMYPPIGISISYIHHDILLKIKAKSPTSQPVLEISARQEPT
jgi:hypothetical protein